MNESQLTDAGVRFVQGANSFSVVGSHGEMENTAAQHTAVMASYARALGAGVKWHANIIWNSTESGVKMSDNSVKAASAPGDDIEAMAATEMYADTSENSGAAIVTGIKVVF